MPHCIPCESQRYRVFTHHGNLELLKHHKEGHDQVIKECYYSYTAEEAMGIYVALHDRAVKKLAYMRASSLLSTNIGSDKMKEVCAFVTLYYCTYHHHHHQGSYSLNLSTFDQTYTGIPLHMVAAM